MSQSRGPAAREAAPRPFSGVHFVKPAPLRPGDRVVVVAPSSVVPRAPVLAGMALLRQRYDVVFAPSVFARSGYLAGDDDVRGLALGSALADERVRAIFAARGGYGAMRLLDDALFAAVTGEAAAAPAGGTASEMTGGTASETPSETTSGMTGRTARGTTGAPARRPPWVIGFSDVTALHLELLRAGVCSLHAPNVSGLFAASPRDRAALVAWLEGRAVPAWRGLDVLHGPAPARVRGVAFGGNLALVHALAAAGRLAPPDDAIWFLEDVTEKPYRVDRMLTSLLLSGAIGRARAVVFGEFAQCEPGPDGVAARDVLLDRTRALGVPVLAGAPFGHGADNAPFVLGGEVDLVGNSVHFAPIDGPDPP